MPFSNAKRKHQDAIKEFHKLAGVTKTFGKNKVRVYTTEMCIAQAAYKHYLEPRTLEGILFRKYS